MDIFDQLEYVPETTLTVTETAPEQALPSQEQTPSVNLPLPMRIGETIGRYGGYLAGSPTLSAMGDVARTGYNAIAGSIASDPRLELLRTGQAGIDTTRSAVSTLPALAYAGFRRVVPPVAAAAGRFSVAAEPIVRTAAKYLNPLTSAVLLPSKLAYRVGSEALGGAAEAVVPAVLAARDVAAQGMKRESDYWRNLQPTPLPTRGSPVVRPSVEHQTQWKYPPADPAMRNVGEVYLTPTGPKRWVGNGWTDAAE